MLQYPQPATNPLTCNHMFQQPTFNFTTIHLQFSSTCNKHKQTTNFHQSDYIIFVQKKFSLVNFQKHIFISYPNAKTIDLSILNKQRKERIFLSNFSFFNTVSSQGIQNSQVCILINTNNYICGQTEKLSFRRLKNGELQRQYKKFINYSKFIQLYYHVKLYKNIIKINQLSYFTLVQTILLSQQQQYIICNNNNNNNIKQIGITIFVYYQCYQSVKSFNLLYNFRIREDNFKVFFKDYELKNNFLPMPCQIDFSSQNYTLDYYTTKNGFCSCIILSVIKSIIQVTQMVVRECKRKDPSIEGKEGWKIVIIIGIYYYNIHNTKAGKLNEN
eukprot:TRINITY_DN4741_c4_g1_i1.p1 TRINITY_DN4741_c4_g1~~TRINITY_DN4741_c4_g1_i1.p1  ORF type:complete len:343 (-),score=-7.54 TRINITY_DN4741_c4_g1_i1:581-1570(-)